MLEGAHQRAKPPQAPKPLATPLPPPPSIPPPPSPYDPPPLLSPLFLLHFHLPLPLLYAILQNTVLYMLFARAATINRINQFSDK